MPTSKPTKYSNSKDRKTISHIESRVRSNKAMIYQSRAMIEGIRMLIISNYSAAFMGNRQLANTNTDGIFANRNVIFNNIKAIGDVQENYVNAHMNKSNLDFLKHRSELNTTVLEINEKMAAINTQLVAINDDIMRTNDTIVTFNMEQTAVNNSVLEGSSCVASATSEINAASIAKNSLDMANLLVVSEENSEAIEELLEISIANSSIVKQNKAEINDRRISINDNLKSIVLNYDQIV